MACPAEDFPSAVATLAATEPVDWHLVCFYPPPAALPAGWRVTVASRSLATAAHLWTSALMRRYTRVIVCCHDLAQPTALETLVQFVSTLSARDRTIIDATGNRRPIAPATVGALLRIACVPLLLAIAVLITRAGLGLCRRSPSRPIAPAGRRVSIVVPILPDLSHTFVYREVLALKRRHPEYVIIALERGRTSVLHRDAEALLHTTVFPPRWTPSSYLWRYIREWIRRPLRIAALVRSLQRRTGTFAPGWIDNDPLCLLRLEHMQHSNYLIGGLLFAWLLEDLRIGYVHVYGATYPALRALIAHRLLGTRFSVSTFVDFEYVTPFHLLQEKFRPARFVVACTEVCTTRLRALVAGVDVRLLRHALPSGYASHPRFRTDDGSRRVVYVGRFVAKKGLDLLARACGLLAERGVPVSAHLYGDGPERGALQRLIEELKLTDRVHLHGPVPNEDFYTVMNRSDVFVCPSRCLPDGERDGIPVVLMEAMAAGMAVVSTSVSGIPELIASGHNGWLVEPDQVAALTDAIALLLNSEELRERLGRAAIETVENAFRLEDAVDTLDQWISQETESPDKAVGPATSSRHTFAARSSASSASSATGAGTGRGIDSARSSAVAIADRNR